MDKTKLITKYNHYITENNKFKLKGDLLFFDTEFTGLVNGTELISIGIVDSNNRTFYAELIGYDNKKIDKWLQDNVIDKLLYNDIDEYRIIENTDTTISMKGNKESVAEQIIKWIDNKDVIMYSDCLSYDWVVFCDLFGGALNCPKNIYYIPFDICTMFIERGIDPDIDREEYAEFKGDKGAKHNALHDALIIKDCYTKMNSK